jgi:hypothetical protein
VISEVGSNVVATGSGSLDLAALSFQYTTGGYTGTIYAAGPVVGFGDPYLGTGADSFYRGFSGPSSFGPGTNIFSASGLGSGPFLYLSPSNGGYIGVPQGYVSGTQLGVSTSVWNNQSLPGLGLTVGIYVYTWGSGSTADSFTVDVTPEPG